jgi:hypothetical protein
MIGGIHLFGAQAVRDPLSPLSEELERLGAHISKLQREARACPTRSPTAPRTGAGGRR